MTVALQAPLRQRADYTHKFNAKTGRHGWLRLTPAYSLKVVEEIVTDYSPNQLILDPFCGTGTTALSATYHGHRAVTTDINPFLIWLAHAKTRHYSLKELSTASEAAIAVGDRVASGATNFAPPPPIHNIERWWPSAAIEFLQATRESILTLTQRNSAQRDLLLIAFCRSLIEQSNAAFNHQSMSFKEASEKEISLAEMINSFLADVEFVLDGAHDNPSGNAEVVFADARALQRTELSEVSAVITSPPYANRMSYIRELRPYMYWLGFLESGRDAGEMDWTAIGGTWGVATSRLTAWDRPTDHFRSSSLKSTSIEISHAANKNGPLLGKYVVKYFDDMWAHFRGLTSVLAKNAEVHYIVGNSTFYGSLVSTELLYAEMLEALGFTNVECRPIRKRNSKKELIEFDVTARWR